MLEIRQQQTILISAVTPYWGGKFITTVAKFVIEVVAMEKHLVPTPFTRHLKILQKKTSHTNILNVIGSIVKNIMLIIGIITSLGTLGVNVSGIVAGLGITGVALSLALKDILSNFISGILIFMHEPFKLGDFVEIEGKSGKVIGINLRYVTIDAEGKNILVPNLISASKIVIIHKNHN